MTQCVCDADDADGNDGCYDVLVPNVKFKGEGFEPSPEVKKLQKHVPVAKTICLVRSLSLSFSYGTTPV